jgi:hypothetical protein
MLEIMIPAFLYVYLKKNARANDSGIFICKMKKKRQNYSSGVLYVKNGKKMLKLMVPAFLCNINHKKKLFNIFIYEFQEKNAFFNNFQVGSDI